MDEDDKIVITLDDADANRRIDRTVRNLGRVEDTGDRVRQALARDMAVVQSSMTGARETAVREQRAIANAAGSAARERTAHERAIANEARMAAQVGKLAARDEARARVAAQREVVVAARAAAAAQVAASRQVAAAARQATSEYHKQAAAQEAAFGRLSHTKTSRGARKITNDDLGSYAGGAPGMAAQVAGSAGLAYAAAGAGALYGLNIAKDLADSWTNAGNRIRQLTKDTEEFNFVQGRLYEGAQQISISLSDHVALYQKVGKAALAMGRTQEQAINVTELISKAVKASGADAVSANAALRQLGQSLDSGIYRGEEFNSVNEQAAVINDLLAKSLGVTRGQLRGMAEDGLLTSKVVIEAIEDQAAAIEESYGKRIPTIGDSITRFKNEMSKAVGEFVQGTGAGQMFAQVMDRIGLAIKAVLNVLTMASRAIMALNDALGGLPLEILDKLASLSNVPLKVIAEIGKTPGPVEGRGGEGFRDSEAYMRGEITQEEFQARAFQRRADYAAAERFDNDATTSAFGVNFGGTTNADVDAFVAERARLEAQLEAERAKAAAAPVQALLNPAAPQGGSFLTQPGGVSKPLGAAEQADAERAFYAQAADERLRAEAAEKAKKEADKQSKKDATSAAAEAEQRAEKLRSMLVSLRDEVDKVGAAERELAQAQFTLNSAVEAGLIPQTEAVQIMERKRDALRDQLDPLAAYLRGIDEEVRLLGLSVAERDREKQSIEATNELRKAGVDLSAEEILLIEQRIDKLNAARDADRERNETLDRQAAILESLRAPQKNYEQGLSDLAALYESEKISALEYSAAVQDVERAYRETQKQAELVKGPLDQMWAKFLPDHDFAEQINSEFKTAFDGIIDGLARMASSADATWTDFANSALSAIQQVIFKMALLETLKMISPSVGGSIGEALLGIPGFRTGGSFRVGSGSGGGGPDSQLVMFRASPNEHVEVRTPEQQQRAVGGGSSSPMSPLVLNNRMIVVDDPRRGLDAIGTSAYDRVSITWLRRNKAAVKQILDK